MARKKEGRPRVRVHAAASLAPPRCAPPSTGLGSSELGARRRRGAGRSAGRGRGAALGPAAWEGAPPGQRREESRRSARSWPPASSGREDAPLRGVAPPRGRIWPPPWERGSGEQRAARPCSPPLSEKRNARVTVGGTTPEMRQGRRRPLEVDARAALASFARAPPPSSASLARLHRAAWRRPRRSRLLCSARTPSPRPPLAGGWRRRRRRQEAARPPHHLTVVAAPTNPAAPVTSTDRPLSRQEAARPPQLRALCLLRRWPPRLRAALPRPRPLRPAGARASAGEEACGGEASRRRHGRTGAHLATPSAPAKGAQRAGGRRSREGPTRVGGRERKRESA